MTPDELCKSGSEHGEQRALFAWIGMAERYGFALAWDDRTYSNGAIQQFEPGGVNRHIAYPVPELAWCHAIPNGGLRDKVTAGKLKHEGVKRGISDVFLPVPCWGVVSPGGSMNEPLRCVTYCGLYIEMKRTGTTKEGTRKAEIIDRAEGKLSAEQEAWITYARHSGYAVSVCFDWRSAARDIERYIEAVRKGAK